MSIKCYAWSAAGLLPWPTVVQFVHIKWSPACQHRQQNLVLRGGFYALLSILWQRKRDLQREGLMVLR